jgi:long-chain acyl-CoA synthetase
MKTILHHLNARAQALGERPALWSKRQGTWQATSWNAYSERVRRVALGLDALGFGPGQNLLVMGFNREEWVVTSLAAMACGGAAVGIYTTSSSEQLVYIANHSGASMMVVETVAMLRLVQASLPQIPQLKVLFVMDPDSELISQAKPWSELMHVGQKSVPAHYDAMLEKLEENNLAQLIYTSGTTGNPKGVMLSHKNIVWTAQQLSLCHPTDFNDVLLSYLPLSHIAEQVCSIYGPVYNGLQVYFAESFEALPENLKEVRPTLFFGVPRVWEKFKAKAEQRIASETPTRQRIVKWARTKTLEHHRLRMAHGKPPRLLNWQYALAQRLVFKKLRARIGFDRVKVICTSAAPIGLDVLEFFTSLDLPLAEIYGQSEVTGPTTVSTLQDMKLGKLGLPMPGVEVKIADDGEILVRGDNVCQGYFRDEIATGELLQNGWLHSGDIGELDAEGFLSITGRKKEILVTSGGKKTSPALIEALLKQISPVGGALVCGDNRNYLVALLTVDPERLKSMPALGFPVGIPELIAHPAFLEWLTIQIEQRVNAKVSRFETIKKFKVLPADFGIETGELTSTLKLRRKVCELKFKREIESLYL